MLLYGSTDSGHSYKVRSFLLLSVTPHKYQWIDLDMPRPARPPAFVAASRFGEVPVLVDEGTALCQSNAILMYLAQRTNTFCGNRSEWNAIVEWLSWEANRIGFSVPNLRYSLRRGHQSPEVVAYLRSRALADLQTLDEELSRTEFLLPSGPTVADLACSAYLFWLSQAGIAEAEFPHVARWLRSLRALPGWVHPDDAMKSQPRARSLSARFCKN
jgi:glutathione S-transferase